MQVILVFYQDCSVPCSVCICDLYGLEICSIILPISSSMSTKYLCTMTPDVIRRKVLKKRLPQVVNDVFYRDNCYEDHISAPSFNFEVPALATPMKHSRKMLSSKQLTQVDTKMYLREQILHSHKRLLRNICYHWIDSIVLSQ